MNNTIRFSSYVIRPISDSEISLIKEFLYLAVFVPPGEDPFPRKLLNEPMLSKEYENWEREGDML